MAKHKTAEHESKPKESHGGRKPLTGGFWVTIKNGEGAGRHVYLKGVRGQETPAQRKANDATLRHGHGVHPGHPSHGHVESQRAPARAAGRGTPERANAATEAKIMRQSGKANAAGLARKTDLRGETATNVRAYKSGVERARREIETRKAATASAIAKRPEVIGAKRNARLAEVAEKRGLNFAPGDANKLIRGRAETVAKIRAKYSERLKAVRTEQVAGRQSETKSTPSLREQAAAHRRDKGPQESRAGRLLSRANKEFSKSKTNANRAIAKGDIKRAEKHTNRAEVISRRTERLSQRLPGASSSDIPAKFTVVPGPQKGLPKPKLGQTRTNSDKFPSLREQAAAHRAGKGTREQRLVSMKAASIKREQAAHYRGEFHAYVPGISKTLPSQHPALKRTRNIENTIARDKEAAQKAKADAERQEAYARMAARRKAYAAKPSAPSLREQAAAHRAKKGGSEDERRDAASLLRRRRARVVDAKKMGLKPYYVQEAENELKASRKRVAKTLKPSTGPKAPKWDGGSRVHS